MVKYKDQRFLVNSWTMDGGSESEFIWYIRVTGKGGPERSRPDQTEPDAFDIIGEVDDMPMRYEAEIYDEDGNVREVLPNIREDALENYETFPPGEQENLPVDKDRPTFQADCPRCGEITDIMLITTDSLRYVNVGGSWEDKAWNCTSCSYTYYGAMCCDLDELPEKLVQFKNTQYEEEVVSWATDLKQNTTVWRDGLEDILNELIR